MCSVTQNLGEIEIVLWKRFCYFAIDGSSSESTLKSQQITFLVITSLLDVVYEYLFCVEML